MINEQDKESSYSTDVVYIATLETKIQKVTKLITQQRERIAAYKRLDYEPAVSTGLLHAMTDILGEYHEQRAACHRRSTEAAHRLQHMAASRAVVARLIELIDSSGIGTRALAKG